MTSLTLIGLGCGCWLLAALAARFFRAPERATLFGAGGALTGALLHVLAAARQLAAPAGRVSSLTLTGWPLPGGPATLELDGLSAWFLLAVNLLLALTAIYGMGYLYRHATPRRAARSWCGFNLLAFSLTGVLLARHTPLFLLAWEGMALTSGALALFDREKPAVRRAVWLYLVFSQLGAAALLAVFLTAGRITGRFDFTGIGLAFAQRPDLAVWLWTGALLGFGVKAGFFLLHVWLPEAHPVAPAHVSAVLSGALTKMGIYGLLRLAAVTPDLPGFTGWSLLIWGALSALAGIIFALAQADFKRLLAYSSIENIGLITMGAGLGMICARRELPWSAALAWGGALLHVLQHALAKGLLFFSAGAVQHAAHTVEMNELGGLLKRMPHTGRAALAGAAALSGLPPFAGFLSEWMIYAAAFLGLTSRIPSAAAAGLTAIAALALTGGLTLAAMTKTVGIVFLGEPRAPAAAAAREVNRPMRWALNALASGALGLGVAAAWMPRLLSAPLDALGGPETTLAPWASVFQLLSLTLALSALLYGWARIGRRERLAARPVAAGPTWDCGYLHPTPRMAYTATSFSRPLTALFRDFLRPHIDEQPVSGYVPAPAAYATRAPDTVLEKILRPLTIRGLAALRPLRRLQGGQIHLYLLYLALTLLGLLVWATR